MATYNFTVRAKDESGAFSDRDFSIQVKNNLIDRMMLVATDHVYTSPDGITFTQRDGKGGIFGGCYLDKWFVQTGTQTYRTSSDTINWNENNTMTISDGKGVIANNTAFALDTSYREEHIVEHNKKLYALASTASTKPFLVSTTDLITWELVLPTNQVTVHNTVLGYNSPVVVNSSEVGYVYSNILVDGDDLVWFDSRNKMFVKYNTISNTTTVVNPTLAHATFGNTTTDVGYPTNVYWFLQKVNGVYVVCMVKNTLQKMWYSVDLVNFNLATVNTTSSVSGAQNLSKPRTFYHNGVMYFVTPSLVVYATTPTELKAISSTALSKYFSVDIFKGKFYQVDRTTGTTSYYRVGDDIRVGTATNATNITSIQAATIHTIVTLK